MAWVRYRMGGGELVVQRASPRAGATFYRAWAGGEAARCSEWLAVVQFKASRLQGTSYRGDEAGMMSFNWGSVRGVERHHLV
jgi:hypothetical protein